MFVWRWKGLWRVVLFSCKMVLFLWNFAWFTKKKFLEKKFMSYCHLNSNSIWVSLLPKPSSFWVSTHSKLCSFWVSSLPVTKKEGPGSGDTLNELDLGSGDTQNGLDLGSKDMQNKLDLGSFNNCFLLNLFFGSAFMSFKCAKSAEDSNTSYLRRWSECADKENKRDVQIKEIQWDVNMKRIQGLHIWKRCKGLRRLRRYGM